MNYKLKIINNTLAQAISKVVSVSLTFITTIFVIRLGGQDLFGQFTKALALIAIGATAIDFGLNAIVVREMGTKSQKARDLLGEAIITRIYLSFFVVVVLNIIILFLPGGYQELKSVFWLGSLAIIFQGIFLSSNAWFQHTLSYWKTTLSSSLGTLIYALLTVYFVRTNGGVLSLLMANTAGYFVMAIVSLILLSPLPHINKSIKPALHLLKKALPLGLVLVFSILSSKFDTIFLGIFRTSSEVGEYGLAYRIFDVALTLPTFVMNAVYPLLISGKDQVKASLIKRSTTTLFLFGIIGTIILYPLSPLIGIIKADLALAPDIFRILILFLPLFYLTSPLMWSMIEQKKERSLLLVYVGATIINALGNLLLIPRYGASGSAWMTGVTEVFILLCLVYYSNKST